MLIDPGSDFSEICESVYFCEFWEFMLRALLETCPFIVYVVVKCFYIYKIQVRIPWCFIWCVWSPHFDAQLGSCSYVIPISTDFFMCLTFMSNLYQQISYMSHYHLCHTYINEFSMCLLFRMISMSNLYQRISHMSHYHVCHFYVQPISTNSIYVSLSES